MTGDDDTYQSNGEDSCSDEENARDKDFVNARQLYDDIMRDPDVDVVEEVFFLPKLYGELWTSSLKRNTQWKIIGQLNYGCSKWR